MHPTNLSTLLVPITSKTRFFLGSSRSSVFVATVSFHPNDLPRTGIVMPHATPPRILFIDAYDSFTNNIISLLETKLNVVVTVVKIDDQIDDFPVLLRQFKAVVAGPGPGDPRNAEDVGLFQQLWRLDEADLVPVLGICLGFQSLVLAFGGSVQQLNEPRHGLIRRVRSNGESIFRGIETLETVQYHSLHASVENPGMTCSKNSHNLSQKCSALQPLAYDFDEDNNYTCLPKPSSESQRKVLMAVEHMSKPFTGVQFHAESICSSEAAQQVIVHWWENAVGWHRARRNLGGPSRKFLMASSGEEKLIVVMTNETAENTRLFKSRSQSAKSRPAPLGQSKNAVNTMALPEILCRKDSRDGVSSLRYARPFNKSEVVTEVLDLGSLTVPSICATLSLTKGQSIILDSENHQRSDVGEYSIIGLISKNSLRFDYDAQCNELRQILHGQSTRISVSKHGGDVFSYLKMFLKQHRANSEHSNIPFWGGLMGYINYETCLQTIGVNRIRSTGKGSSRPDLSFCFVERSIVIDHAIRKVYVQSIRPHDTDWISGTASLLKDSKIGKFKYRRQTLPAIRANVSLPDEETYKAQVRTCQSAIRAGDSYEICLTTQANIRTTEHLPSWPLYLRLRALNPSPFAAYLHLGNLTLLSSSPERFLRWSRPSRESPKSRNSFGDKTSICQFRPIKGTVKRQPEPRRPPLTLEEATALLSIPKERAENLMIVDLIRHDLHGVVGSGRVNVPKLMVVEEYATLFQLVSVIEGSLIVNENDEEEDTLDSDSPRCLNIIPMSDISKPEDIRTSGQCKSGIDVLAASLPPGSMTGAPKLRSCQILQNIEQRDRGVYSGVVGYMDVGGGGDFSVVIRSAFRWDDSPSASVREGYDGNGDEEEAAEKRDTWNISAGGAVTSLSSEDGEWEEMIAKLRSTLRLFEDQTTSTEGQE